MMMLLTSMLMLLTVMVGCNTQEGPRLHCLVVAVIDFVVVVVVDVVVGVVVGDVDVACPTIPRDWCGR